MQLGLGETLTLLGVVASAAANLVTIAYLFGQLKAKVLGLEEKQKDNALRFDADLGRLNAKVDNDVQGRRAVAAMQERVARLEERDAIRSERAA